MKFASVIIVAASIVAFGVIQAPAEIITYTDDDSGSAPASGFFSVDQFDTSLGTLLSVRLDVTGNSSGGTNEVENEDDSGGNATLEIGTDITVTGPAAALVVLTMPQEEGTQFLASDDDADPDWAGLDWFKITGSTSNDSKWEKLVSVAGGGSDDVSAYEGTGTVQFDWAAVVNTSNSISVSPTSSRTTPTSFDFETTVTYTYYIPEPSSFVLAVVGLFALGLCGWHRRRRSC